jgi:hypothetical protein
LKAGLFAAVVLVIILISVLAIGCGERNSPIAPSPSYRMLGAIQTPGWAQDVAAFDDTAYVADNMGGIAVIDIRDVSNPTYVESWPSSRLVKQIKVAPVNRLLLTYESTGNAGIKIYSIDQKAMVSEGGSSGARDIAVLETPGAPGSFWAFATDLNDGFLGNKYVDTEGYWIVLDAIRQLQPPFGEYRGMELVGDSLVFACLDERGVIAVNMDLELTSNEPDTIDWVETPGSARDVVYQDGYLYIADYFDGLIVMDATDPADMSIVAQVTPKGASRCTKVAVDGETAAVMDDFDGIYLFNISVPYAPVYLDLISLPEPSGLSFYNGLLFATDEALGLSIYQP